MEKRLYTKNDIVKMLANISLEDTFNEKQVTDFTEFIKIFYELGKAMGMSSFVCKAALHDLVEQACKG